MIAQWHSGRVLNLDCNGRRETIQLIGIAAEWQNQRRLCILRLTLRTEKCHEVMNRKSRP